MPSANSAATIIVSCWLVWLVVWILQWTRKKPEIEHQNGETALSYSALLFAGIILMNGRFSRYIWNTHHLYRYTPLIGFVGVVVAVSGISIAVWCRFALSDNWSADVSFKKGQVLKTDGPYAFVRHPMYTGFSLLFIGTAMYQGTVWSFAGCALGILSFWIKLRLEEALMTKHFGEAYTEYQRRTKRLIPFLL